MSQLWDHMKRATSAKVTLRLGFRGSANVVPSTTKRGVPNISWIAWLILALSFLAASKTAIPWTVVVREATVGPESGTREVSTGAIWITESGTSRASAAIWASTVMAPWPISVFPTATVMEPSASSFT
jgi:hypothetical protein